MIFEKEKEWTTLSLQIDCIYKTHTHKKYNTGCKQFIQERSIAMESDLGHSHTGTANASRRLPSLTVFPSYSLEGLEKDKLGILGATNLPPVCHSVQNQRYLVGYICLVSWI